MNEPISLPQGRKRMGKYEILRELGRGGMGVVYEARDTELDRRVALKMMLPQSPFADEEDARQDQERFLREARLSANLEKHPFIVSVYEAGVLEGRRYISMEFVDGQPMSKWRKSGVPVRRQVELLRDVVVAVQHAHRHKVVHRDLKGDNVLVDAQGRPHVTDFGLAKSAAKASPSITTAGMVMGTPTHMSPEQAEGRADVDHRADVYSLGVMLFEILTGRLPYQGLSAMEVLRKAAVEPVPSPSTFTRKPGQPVDQDADRICLRALAKKPADRYQSAEAFAADLARWLNREPLKAPAHKRRPLPAPKKRASWGIGIGVAAVVFGAVLWSVVGSGGEPLPASPAAKKDPLRQPTPVVGARTDPKPPATAPQGGAEEPQDPQKKIRRAPLAPPVFGEKPQDVEKKFERAPLAPAVFGEPGLVGHWRFDEASGATAADSSGKGHDGVLEGGTTWAPGKLGGCAVFTGGASCVSVPDAPDLRLAGDMSAAFWVRMDAPPRDHVRLVGKGGKILSFWLWLRPGENALLFQSTHNTHSKKTLEQGRWHHVAATRKGRTESLYLDGVLRESGEAPTTLVPPMNADPVTFGYGAGAFGVALNGALDDMRLYSRALSAQEVADLAAGRRP